VKLTKAGALLLGALLLFSSCATCKSFSFPNDSDDRPLCRAYGSTDLQVDYREEDYQVEVYVNLQIEHRVSVPDNTVIIVPPWIKEDGEKTPEMYFNFDDGSGWEPVMRRC
jgi:hypothetical protein